MRPSSNADFIAPTVNFVGNSALWYGSTYLIGKIAVIALEALKLHGSIGQVMAFINVVSFMGWSLTIGSRFMQVVGIVSCLALFALSQQFDTIGDFATHFMPK